MELIIDYKIGTDTQHYLYFYYMIYLNADAHALYRWYYRDAFRIVTEILWYVSRYSVAGDTQPYWFRVSSVVIAVFVIAMCSIDCDFSWIRFWGRISKFHSNDVWVGYCSSALLRIYDLLAHIDLFVFQCMRIISAQTEYHEREYHEREREREREREIERESEREERERERERSDRGVTE